VQSLAVGIRVHGDGCNSHFARRADNANRNLTAIRN
jgi:hypothetical protein